MVPTLCQTLGVKGHRPLVGTRDCKDLLYVAAPVNVVTAALHTRTLESRAQAKQHTGLSKIRRLQTLFVTQLADLARRYPASAGLRVVILIDNAPWHRGHAVTQVLAAFSHLELYPLPSYSLQ